MSSYDLEYPIQFFPIWKTLTMLYPRSFYALGPMARLNPKRYSVGVPISILTVTSSSSQSLYSSILMIFPVQVTLLLGSIMSFASLYPPSIWNLLAALKHILPTSSEYSGFPLNIATNKSD